MPARTGDVLSQRALNRALLARQHLLERATTPIPRLLDRIGGIQAQYAPSMYVGLAARLDGFVRADLDTALDRRAVVVGTLMRSTIHLVSSADYWPLAVAIRHPRREWFLRISTEHSDAELTRAAAALRAHLRESSPVRQRDLDAVVGGRARRLAVGLWLDLLRVPPSSTWARRRADLYAAAEDELGAPPDLDPDDARRHLVRRYLAGFGPATAAETADWAGLPTRTVTAVLDGMTLRRFRAEDGAELVDLSRQPLPDPDTPAPVRFLPTWDATLLVHARRTQILPERHRPKVFSTRTPQSVATFLVDGQVAGTWRYADGRVELTEFEPLDPGVRRQLAEEADRLVALHA
jgi:hypothetical protein